MSPQRPAVDVIDTVNRMCMAERQARAKVAQKTCKCGKPAVFAGRCRGCDEDRFYGRDTGNHIGIE